MCMVSVIQDYARERVKPIQWTKESLDEFKSILRQVEELDKKLNQPDCDDLRKAEWMKEVEERLEALENDDPAEGFEVGPTP